MATVIKKISELEHLEELTSASNVIIEENGKAKRFSAANLGKVKTVNGVEPDENGNIKVEVGSGGSGVSAQPDYNQNDPTAADYIKNRPFYTGNLVETEVLDVNAVISINGADWQLDTQIDDTTALWNCELEFTPELEVDKEYTVLIDGIEYSTTTTDMSAIFGYSSIGFGDIDALLSDDVESDSFAYVAYWFTDMPLFAMLYKGASAPTELKIFSKEQEIVKLDPKYLPEGGVGYTESASTTETFDILQIANDFGTELISMPESESPTGNQVYIMQLAESNLPINFIVGNEYQISINGTSYVDEALDMSDEAGFPYVVIGDIDCMMSNDYSGFRYITAIMQPSDEAYQFLLMLDAEAFSLTETPTEFTISGSAVTETIHKIDSKYLPEQVKSDWNENDPNADGYIANRPFYEANVAGDVLFEEQTFEDFSGGQLPEPVAFVEGETYFVTFDGQQYECVAWFDETLNSMFGEDAVGLGSTAFIGYTNEGGNNEPFFLAYTGDYTGFSVEEYGTHTLKIQSATMAVAKKIDKKFLPDDIGSSSKSVEHIVFIDAKTGFEYMGYIYDGNWITCRKPDKVEVTTMPDKTKYKFDEQFDSTGMIITATYSDGSTSEINNYSYPEDISETFAIYCIDGAMYMDINLTVYKELSSVEIISMPDKTLYDFGEAFDPTGMIITGICTDGTSVEITDYTYPEEVSEVFEIYCVGYDVTVSINLDIGPEMLRDFRYIVNNDGTYTLTEWKGTLNGETSNSLVIPDSPDIIL